MVSEVVMLIKDQAFSRLRRISVHDIPMINEWLYIVTIGANDK